MTLPEMEIEEVVNEVIWSVFRLRDLLKYHLALPINLLAGEHGFEEDIRQQFRCHLDVFAKHLGVITGVLLASESVEHAPDCINLFGDPCRAPPFSSLEEQVLDEV